MYKSRTLVLSLEMLFMRSIIHSRSRATPALLIPKFFKVERSIRIIDSKKQLESNYITETVEVRRGLTIGGQHGLLIPDGLG